MTACSICRDKLENGDVFYAYSEWSIIICADCAYEHKSIYDREQMEG